MSVNEIAEQAAKAIFRNIPDCPQGQYTFVRKSRDIIESAIEKARRQWDDEEAGGVGEQRRANRALSEDTKQLREAISLLHPSNNSEGNHERGMEILCGLAGVKFKRVEVRPITIYAAMRKDK